MKAKQTLPYGYQEIFSLDLQNGKKAPMFVNMIALSIAVIMFVPMNFFMPLTRYLFFNMTKGFHFYILRWVVFILASLSYIILHELVHGMTMKYFGCQKVKYGFIGLYAYAGSEDFFDKKSYIVIALAPVVLWGIVLLIINLLVSDEWIWIVYLIQITNISGAAGDFYVTAKFLKMPEDILVKDRGVSMTVYAPKQQFFC